MFDEIDELIQQMVEFGALELGGVDDDGEIVYHYNLEKFEEFSPEMYHAYMDEIDQEILNLMEKGLVTLDFSTIDDDVVVQLTEKGREWAEAYTQMMGE